MDGFQGGPAEVVEGAAQSDLGYERTVMCAWIFFILKKTKSSCGNTNKKKKKNGTSKKLLDF